MYRFKYLQWPPPANVTVASIQATLFQLTSKLQPFSVKKTSPSIKIYTIATVLLTPAISPPPPLIQPLQHYTHRSLHFKINS
ncbi:hypothetical protein HanRHA438_Chr08g0364601 [Helianthus annuus]|uniref:Uncharacterized protein n=1 Tax=Helianthus annuus TaxID=4232 RepID=A0A251U8V6_HELAN|nr:hypothetical protein HanXRQr2_Chr08g0352461 [Helianthus annuus]KAJ0446364.1 hypothetical protein HanHA89_Chr17g0693501 [Helianthus annuus]KAJ0539815.1 hypothetical protein HanHA300_Chr08g0290791 [Helianthus annuus]KAJ0899111.1 hypothetical protein HanRHA438_Chr08g0364601 [Helianthus annuus]KAJ0902719.1 hypothetical protein HanPSC8_Chr08g0340401 [Helianthus annuus]